MTKEEIRKSLLSMYLEIERICQKHKLKYFVTGGAVIGAIRHQGFIPWDDDLDIALPREDYEKFVVLANQELPESMELVIRERARCGLLMDKYTNIEYADWIKEFLFDIEGHVFIDIQPFDGLPNNCVKRWIHSRYTFICRAIFKLCDMDKVVYKVESGRPKWEITLIHIWKSLQLSRLVNEEKAKKRYDAAMKKYSYYDYDWVADFVGKYMFKDIYPKIWWEPGGDHVFEDITIRMPSQYDKYLTQIYGDYMKLPEDKVEHIQNKE